jgi:hypothetical protein
VNYIEVGTWSEILCPDACPGYGRGMLLRSSRAVRHATIQCIQKSEEAVSIIEIVSELYIREVYVST